MSKKPHFDYHQLKDRLKSLLLRRGASSAKELIQALDVSQPVFSRLVKSLGPDIWVAGRASSARYALKRGIAGGASEIPIYQVDNKGTGMPLGNLHSIQPKGFYFEAKRADVKSGFFEDLPYWLDDLRPSGFLGRLVPQRHSDLGFPGDIQNWSTDQVLSYLIRFGWDTVGDLILGNEAYRLFQNHCRNRPTQVRAGDRKLKYPQMAEQVLEFGVPGSSAGGEQPKFLAIRMPTSVPVLVKFSPPLQGAVGRRRGDLLVSEHLAHEVLRTHGKLATHSSLLSAGGRIFLENERFDRVGARGRRGTLSLHALDSQFVGSMGTWSQIAAGLAREKRIDEKTRTQIRWLEIFGELIFNTDMHAGNLGFFADCEHLDGLAPVYDMLPMGYAPVHDQITERTFDPRGPLPMEMSLWDGAFKAALDFWGRVAEHPLVSSGFRKTAKRSLKKLRGLAQD